MLTASNSNQKLASLLALSAGALALPQTGLAAIVYTDLSSGPVKIGFSPGFGSGLYRLNLPGTHAISLWTGVGAVKFGGSTSSTAAIRRTYVASHNLVAHTGPGKTWGQIGTGTSSHTRIARASTAGTNPGYANQYLAFRFVDTTSGNQTEYGWAKITLDNSGATRPDVTLWGYAYDDSGNHILTGDIGGSAAVPEPPQTAGMAVLGALALGAVGVRRWRAQKQSN